MKFKQNSYVTGTGFLKLACSGIMVRHISHER